MSNRQNLSSDRHEYRSTLFSSTDVGVDPAKVRETLLRQMIGVPPSRPMVEAAPITSERISGEVVPEVSERIQ